MLIVRKPFDEELEELNKENKKEEYKEEYKENKEEEEKPVAIASSMMSEDVHGGEESTESLENTTNNSKTNENKSESNEGSSVNNVDDSKEKNNGEGEKKEEISGEEMEKEEGEEESSEGEEEKIGEEKGDKGDNEAEESEESEGEEVDVKSEEGEDSSTEKEVEESEEGEDDSEEQEDTYMYNTQQAFDVDDDVDTVRYYQTEFYRFIEMISEEKTKLYDPRFSEEYNIKKLMFRQYEKKPLNNYRQSRIRDSVILILDNSGSMEWWSVNISMLAKMALERDDIEIYIAPNGYIERKLSKSKLIKVDHESAMKSFNGRKIIYVGDFDGANTAIVLSFNNDVVWICPETRYRRFSAHGWVNYDESDFKGAFLRVYSLDEMFYALKKLLSYQYIRNIWIDLHENDRFEDDGDEQ